MSRPRTTSANRPRPKKKVRKTPTLLQVQAMYGDVPVGPYDPHFLVREGKQGRAVAKIKLITKAGEKLLADPKVGLNNITTAMVAARVKMSIGSFYRYFEDITALLDYIWPERVVTFKRSAVVVEVVDAVEAWKAEAASLMDEPQPAEVSEAVKDS